MEVWVDNTLPMTAACPGGALRIVCCRIISATGGSGGGGGGTGCTSTCGGGNGSGTGAAGTSTGGGGGGVGGPHPLQSVQATLLSSMPHPAPFGHRPDHVQCPFDSVIPLAAGLQEKTTADAGRMRTGHGPYVGT
eukprot:gene14639-biopygen15687